MKQYIFVLTILCFSKLYSQDKKEEEILKIPIVFHIISDSLVDGDYSDSYFYRLIELVNHGFNEVDINRIDSIYRKDVAVCNIEFYIPEPDNSGSFDPISWHYTSKQNYHPLLESKKIRTLEFGRLNTDKVLNVWFFNFSTPPEITSAKAFRKGEDAGIIMALRTIENQEAQFLLPHEIGHFFNLEHLWGTQEGILTCNRLNDDYVEDTPLQKEPNNSLKLRNGDTIKVCYEPYKNSMYQNFMDYGYRVGMFTQGQKERMRNYIKSKRRSLTKEFDYLTMTNTDDEIIVSVSNTFTDTRDSKKYTYVRMGNKNWMADNLNYSSPNSACYSDKNYNCSIYGRLYDWNEAVTACPDGWRLPTLDEWKEMVEYVNNDVRAIKSEQGWIKENGSNSRQLNILPSGYYTVTRRFRGLGSRASFWLADDLGNNTNRNSRTIRDGLNQIPLSGTNFSREKLSCRCIQDN